ncbi:MAG: hypothetical protein HY795_06030 [Desulfovibrio sp.]|nr:hypothetical protein [Desulfovibrio sp.]MBI4961392.1 hypothetical protein [Desulfovibrio sp.]
MKKVILAICTVIMLSISSNAFSMGFFPTTQPTLPAASTEGKSDWRPSVSNSSSGIMYSVYSPSADVGYSAFPRSNNVVRVDSAYNTSNVTYSSFWDKFGGLF